MWQLLSRPLEWLGALRIGFSRRRAIRVGDPNVADATGGFGWRDYLEAERLFDAWGPMPESPWTPYHAVPLFASIDRIRPEDIGPGEPDVMPVSAFPLATPGAPAPSWLIDSTLTVVDLPGPDAVEVGAWMVQHGCQPVCTFDNWPHTRGLIKAERILAALLRWTTTVVQARWRLMAHSAPVWICDSARLGDRVGRPGEFDNRYYLDDSILPSASVIQGAGLSRVVYVTGGMTSVPTIDLDEFFVELRKAGLEMLHVDLTRGLDAVDLVLPVVPRPAPDTGFRRSSAGGFGTEVPQPSSSSSG